MHLLYLYENQELTAAIDAGDEAGAIQKLQAIITQASLAPSASPSNDIPESQPSFLTLAAKKRMHALILKLVEYYDSQSEEFSQDTLEKLLPQESYPFAFAITLLKSQHGKLILEPAWIKDHPRNALDLFQSLTLLAKKENDSDLLTKLTKIQPTLYTLIYAEEKSFRIKVTAGVAILSFFIIGPLCFIPALITYFVMKQGGIIQERAPEKRLHANTGNAFKTYALNGKKVAFDEEDRFIPDPKSSSERIEYYLMIKGKAKLYDAAREKQFVITPSSPLTPLFYDTGYPHYSYGYGRTPGFFRRAHHIRVYAPPPTYVSFPPLGVGTTFHHPPPPAVRGIAVLPSDSPVRSSIIEALHARAMHAQPPFFSPVPPFPPGRVIPLASTAVAGSGSMPLPPMGKRGPPPPMRRYTART